MFADFRGGVFIVSNTFVVKKLIKLAELGKHSNGVRQISSDRLNSAETEKLVNRSERRSDSVLTELLAKNDYS